MFVDVFRSVPITNISKTNKNNVYTNVYTPLFFIPPTKATYS
jgi:hypothetical protein